MATQPTAMNIIKQVLIAHQNGISVREIASEIAHISPTTVQRYISMAKEDPLDIDSLVQLDDPELNHRFNGGNPAYCDERFEDFKKRIAYFKQELSKKHMTVQILWEEYKVEVPDGYSLTQFRYHLKQNKIAAKCKTPTTTSALKHLKDPGLRVEIDFAGDKLSYVYMETGEMVEVDTLAMSLPFSDYTFITCIPSQGIEHFLGAVAACLHFFGGVPRILVPDNLKSAVTIADRWSPTLTEGMNELATHYGCSVVPARVRKPKDKPNAESAVRKSYQRIYAPLRNRLFHSLDELNKAVSELLKKYNSRRMQGCDYSRVERFLAAEKPVLQPLPRDVYQMKRHTKLKVAPNCFIKLGHENHHYSVHWKYVGYQLEVIFTDTQVRIFNGGECVATHPRSFSKGGYTWIEEHLPSQTQEYYKYSAQYFIDLADRKYGPTTAHVIREIFDDETKPCEVFFSSAQGILSLGRKTEAEVYLQACKIAIQYEKCNYPFIKKLIDTKCKGYLIMQAEKSQVSSAPSTHSNIRGQQAFQ